MTIDPKYASLPGIDRDQPDIYETSDLPESEQGQFESDEGISEAVEKINLTADEAHGKFKDKQLAVGAVDFSDRLSKNKRTGYDAPRTEYEIVGQGSGSEETPEQKYQRLQHEIRELTDEVNKIQENVKAEASTETLSPVALSKQVEYLQQQLTDLHLDKLVGDSSGLNLSDPQGALQKRLLTELAAFKPPASAVSKTDKPGTTDTDPDHVTYQLYYRPEQAKFSHSARMADLEQRLERMEALLGTQPEKLSALTAETSNKSVIGAVALLSARTKLLEPSQIDLVEGRVTALIQKLNQAAEKKDALENAERQTKVSELYDLMKKWDSLSESLPQIVDRLTALSQLHEQALQFSQTLSHLDTAQQQISANLTSHGEMVKQVNSTLAENMKNIKANLENLDKRMQAVSK